MRMGRIGLQHVWSPQNLSGLCRLRSAGFSALTCLSSPTCVTSRGHLPIRPLKHRTLNGAGEGGRSLYLVRLIQAPPLGFTLRPTGKRKLHGPQPASRARLTSFPPRMKVVTSEGLRAPGVSQTCPSCTSQEAVPAEARLPFN